ncbi:MFS transporter [Aureimonas endophytica]|uniref:MFS transporter n=1 Tax=Aureimonas endophytica TaxID=2027858 RepID=A0A916ZLA2_9HYPH|nr:MFS transporter [Aureimonas endophytica]GGE03164.1 MFS transporter [Aureimonas endophytica]
MRSTSAVPLFGGTILAAAGYGATFLFSAYFHAIGGSDIDTGLAFGAAMLGTFVGVPLVGWLSGRLDAAAMAALAGGAIACGFAILGLAHDIASPWPRLAAGLIGLGWGMFYIGAPMALSERVSDAERGAWFTRFGAFQMAGIGGGPVVVGLLSSSAGWSLRAVFAAVAACAALSAVLLFLFKLGEPLPDRRLRSRTWVRSIGRIAKTASIRPIAMVGLGACVFSGLMSFQGSLVEGTGCVPGTYFAVYAVTVVGMRLAFARRLATLPQRPFAVGLLLILSLGVLAMFGVRLHPGFQILSAALAGIGYGLVYPVIQTWAVNETRQQDRHAALTWFVLSYFVGLFGFPVLGGWVLVQFGPSALLTLLLVAALIELGVLLFNTGTKAGAVQLAR